MHKPDVSEAKHAKQNLRNKTKRKSAKVYRSQGKSTAQTRSLRGKERIINLLNKAKHKRAKILQEQREEHYKTEKPGVWRRKTRNFKNTIKQK